MIAFIIDARDSSKAAEGHDIFHPLPARSKNNVHVVLHLLDIISEVILAFFFGSCISNRSSRVCNAAWYSFMHSRLENNLCVSIRRLCHNGRQRTSMLLNGSLQVPRSVQLDMLLFELHLISNDASHLASLCLLLLHCTFQVLFLIKRRILRCICRMSLNGRFFIRLHSRHRVWCASASQALSKQIVGRISS